MGQVDTLFVDLTHPPECGSLRRARRGSHTANATTYATASRPKQQACHQPADGAGGLFWECRESEGRALSPRTQQAQPARNRTTYGQQTATRQRNRETAYATQA